MILEVRVHTTVCSRHGRNLARGSGRRNVIKSGETIGRKDRGGEDEEGTAYGEVG